MPFCWTNRSKSKQCVIIVSRILNWTMLFTPLLYSIRPNQNNHDYLLSSKHTTRYTMIMFLRNRVCDLWRKKTWTFFVDEIWVNVDVFDWGFCRSIYVTGCFLAGSIDFLEAWQRDTSASSKPVFTEGMCPARPGSGPDGAYEVSSHWSMSMSSLVSSKSYIYLY